MSEPWLTSLIDAGVLGEAAAASVSKLRAQGQSPDEALRDAAPDQLNESLKHLARQFGLTWSELDSVNPSPELLARLPARLLLDHSLMPLEQINGTITVATGRIFDRAGIDELRLASGCNIQPIIAPPQRIAEAIREHLGVGADTLQDLVSSSENQGVQVVAEDEDVDLEHDAEDASIITFVNQVLAEAIELRATDVHFEPFEQKLRVRYRIDGVLRQATIPPEVHRFHAAIVSRIKILSHLDIAEKRQPQDGRIKLKIAGREVDVRVSIIPMLHSEAVVLRLLDRGSPLRGLEALGMSARDRGLFEKVLNLPHGIVLVTGPTGSGKTSTLYAGLAAINDVETKIITIEDPIEYHLQGINQIQVSTKAGLTFARGLRSILRHDPDVILIGEIRDRETADIAVQASLTGHLVFSTLHTNDAPGSMTRLVDMGVEPYLVASSLELVLAQRLLRLICPDCRSPIAMNEASRLREAFGVDLPDKLYMGKGCRRCLMTGYLGRHAIFEMMPVSETIRQMILERESSGRIRIQATREGMKSLREDGWRLIREGMTTLEEVLRVTKDEQGVTYTTPADAEHTHGHGGSETFGRQAAGERQP